MRAGTIMGRVLSIGLALGWFSSCCTILRGGKGGAHLRRVTFCCICRGIDGEVSMLKETGAVSDSVVYWSKTSTERM